jgi:hypothetical protein
MDRDFADEWHRVPLQSCIDEVPDHASLFDMTLGVTIVFSLFELAVELLRIQTLNEVVALVAATALWATLACGAEVFISSALLRFYVLFGTGFVASILMLVSHIMREPLGMALYSLDGLGKCSTVILALQAQSKQ